MRTTHTHTHTFVATAQTNGWKRAVGERGWGGFLDFLSKIFLYYHLPVKAF